MSSRVTAPVCAMALPHGIVAPVLKVMLSAAIIFPSKEVVVPSVAELPTFQNKPTPAPPLITSTAEALAVVRVVPISKMKSEFGLPSASR